VVVEVAAGSVADKAGIAVGDLIVEVDRKGVVSADDARAALRASRRGGHLLRMRGQGGVRFVTLAD
jgi:S1-C subfamily serine protease